MKHSTCLIPGVLLLACLSLATTAQSQEKNAAPALVPLEKAWYTPAELLTALAQREGIQWAIPETLAGRALVDGLAADALLDGACEQWGLNWTQSLGVIVVHCANDARLKTLAEALEKGDTDATWELGWLRDGRALPLLATALASKDEEIALAAAKAIETLDTMVPLGQDERVNDLPTGRVSLAIPFPPREDLSPLLDSPYPPIRAAALRLLLGQTGKAAEAAASRSSGDRSQPVLRVFQQLRPTLPESTAPPNETDTVLPAPKDAQEIKAACAKMIVEIAELAKKSEWEQMRWRVRTMGAWSRANHPEATHALIELSATTIQYGWFPAYVHMHLAATGSPEAVARLKELFPKADRGTMSRGLEQTLYGEALLAYTWSYLDDPTLCYVTTRKAGREVHDDLVLWANRGNIAALDALGVIGGSKAVIALRTQLNNDAPGTDTAVFRSAKALGRIGSSDALDALLAASTSQNRVRRHAATLFLGHIGGPKSQARLRDILMQGKKAESDRLVRAAAAEGLEQIGGKENQAIAAAFRQEDAGLPEIVHQPRNPRFGPAFPVQQWVDLKIPIKTDSAFGEIGWNYDFSNRLFMRYGGCSGYHNELTLFDLGTEQFIQRRPNEKMAGWGDRRLINGCTAGRCWDPLGKVMWLGPAIGSTAPNLATYDYYNKHNSFRFCTYDLATDQFRAAPQPNYATRYAFDWTNGLLYPVKFTHPNHITKDFWAFDVKGNSWLDKKTSGDYPRDQQHATATVDQSLGLLVLYVAPQPDKPAETWTYDPRQNLWKNMQPAVQPAGVPGGGLAYDPFNKVLLLQTGKQTLQYGGPADSITWTYDARTNTWTDLKISNGPGNPWVGAMDYDPEHNAFVLFNFADKHVWALRLKPVNAGMKAE